MTEKDFDNAASFWSKKDKDSARMEKKDIESWIDSFLSSHKVLSLATGADGVERCTPLEYSWFSSALWIFSEGGEKFSLLKKNRNVGAAVFDLNTSFAGLKSLQIQGKAEFPELFGEEYKKAAETRKIPLDALKKLPEPMWLIKITPEKIICLDSDFKKNGFGIRQIWKADLSF